MDGGNVACKYVVSGKVQGVFFRASTAREASRLGIGGHAMNLPDGRVEVLAVGAKDAVEALGRWLERGPPAARVTGVERRDEDAATMAGVTGFSTR